MYTSPANKDSFIVTATGGMVWAFEWTHKVHVTLLPQPLGDDELDVVMSAARVCIQGTNLRPVFDLFRKGDLDDVAVDTEQTPGKPFMRTIIIQENLP
jgi:hypothetical protein